MSINSRGFTLVEVLVISPIIILFIGAFLAMLVSLTGESLVVREKNTAAYDTQSALDDIEASISQAITFLPTTGTVPIPQGKDNSTSTGTPFTNEVSGEPNTLIIRSAATTARPSDASRELIYMGAGACDSRNPLYTYFTIYFTALDPDTSDTTDRALYKRTILPQTPACRTAWQRGSCDVSRMTSHPTICKARDEKLASGVAAFDIQYFIGSSATPVADSQAASATDVSVNLELSKQVAGSPVEYSGTVRANSLNVQTSESPTGAVTPPANPQIDWTRNNNGPNPYRTTFTWPSVGNANSNPGYLFRYRLNGGAWVEQGVAQSANPSFNVEATARKQTIDVEVDVVSSNGTYPYGTRSAAAIPNWNDCQFSGQGAWNNYGTYYGNNVYTTAGYTRTSSGIVGLKGLVKGTTLNVPICTLPEGFRPKFAGEKLIFQVPSANGANWGRIDIFPNGDIVPVQGNTEWFSLDGILFMSDSSNTTWTTLSWQNGWANYNTLYGGTAHATLRTTLDSQGRRHVQGLGGYSGTSPNVPMAAPGGAPNRTLHYPAMSGGPGIVQPASGGSILSRSSPTSYQSLQLVYRLAGATGWQNMPFSSGWTNYDATNWPTMQCHRGADDVVIIQGLIRHPTDGNGTYIGDTSPCGRFRTPNGLATGTSGVEDRLLLSPWTSNEAPGRIDLVNGTSLLSQGTAAGWTALDGFHFIAD